MIQTKTEKEENIFLSGENKSSGYLGTSLDVSFGHRCYSFIFVLFPFIIFLLLPSCTSATYLYPYLLIHCFESRWNECVRIYKKWHIRTCNEEVPVFKALVFNDVIIHASAKESEDELYYFC
jgi:hypothetical protein